MSTSYLPNSIRVVALDDYQGVAGSYVDWRSSWLPIELVQIREHISDERRLRETLVGAHVIIAMRERTPLPASLLAELHDLELVITAGMKNDSIETLPGLPLCGTRMLDTPAAELAWALILAARKRLLCSTRAIQGGTWISPIGIGLAGQTLAVLGLGRTGSQVAAVGKAFGMRVVAWSENLTRARTDELGIELVSKETLFAEADVLSIHLRLSRRSRGLVGAPLLAKMKPSALLVNTARAEIVDEQSLVQALHEEQLGAAALDVFTKEPLPENSPLRNVPNILLTPHIGYVVTQNYELIFADALDCVEKFYAGTPVRLIN